MNLCSSNIILSKKSLYLSLKFRISVSKWNFIYGSFLAYTLFFALCSSMLNIYWHIYSFLAYSLYIASIQSLCEIGLHLMKLWNSNVSLFQKKSSHGYWNKSFHEFRGTAWAPSSTVWHWEPKVWAGKDSLTLEDRHSANTLSRPQHVVCPPSSALCPSPFAKQCLSSSRKKVTLPNAPVKLDPFWCNNQSLKA